MVVTENHPLIFKPNEVASSLLCRKTCPKPTQHRSAAEMPLLKPLSAVILGRYETKLQQLISPEPVTPRKVLVVI